MDNFLFINQKVKQFECSCDLAASRVRQARTINDVIVAKTFVPPVPTYLKGIESVKRSRMHFERAAETRLTIIIEEMRAKGLEDHLQEASRALSGHFPSVAYTLSKGIQ